MTQLRARGESPYGESFATVCIGVHHSAYVEHGAITGDPTVVPGYDCDPPEPGTLLVARDVDGWMTLHRIERRAGGKIEFGQRLPWPDGGIAARRLA